MISKPKITPGIGSPTRIYPRKVLSVIIFGLETIKKQAKKMSFRAFYENLCFLGAGIFFF